MNIQFTPLSCLPQVLVQVNVRTGFLQAVLKNNSNNMTGWGITIEKEGPKLFFWFFMRKNNFLTRNYALHCRINPVASLRWITTDTACMNFYHLLIVSWSYAGQLIRIISQLSVCLSISQSITHQSTMVCFSRHMFLILQ